MQNCNFFADSESRAQELSNDVSFVIFVHQTWDLEGGGQIDPPPSLSWVSSTPEGIGLKISLMLSEAEFKVFKPRLKYGWFVFNVSRFRPAIN